MKKGKDSTPTPLSLPSFATYDRERGREIFLIIKARARFGRKGSKEGKQAKQAKEPRQLLIVGELPQQRKHANIVGN